MTEKLPTSEKFTLQAETIYKEFLKTWMILICPRGNIPPALKSGTFAPLNKNMTIQAGMLTIVDATYAVEVTAATKVGAMEGKVEQQVATTSTTTHLFILFRPPVVAGRMHHSVATLIAVSKMFSAPAQGGIETNRKL
mmetsp:Transcript_19953/g.28065  ORF Transcript_19953/g.28065 Transcript_19953/m.28065 type:complete len:138 (+) Transcript_19953:880-1293(+)